jgi:hypothetical protein
MGLIFCDGFDSYGLAGDLGKKWQTVQSPWQWVAGAGRFGGGCARAISTGGGKLVSTVGSVPTNANCFCFWLKVSAPPAAQSTIIAPVDGTGTVNGEYLAINTNGNIAMYVPFQGGAGTIAPMFIADNVWHWIEWETVGAGSRLLYIDNIQQISTSDAHGATTFSVAVLSIAGITITIDDLIAFDNSTGVPTVANFPLGSRQITTLRPVSDGAVNFATLSAGTTHFNLVNEVNPDGDTSYCEDGASGHQDLFNMSALGFTPAGITTIMANAYMETGVPGTINNQMVCKSGATTTPSSSLVTSNVYSTRQASFPQDPNTSAAWTPSGLAAAQFGYKCP